MTKLEVRWPSGFVEQVSLPGIDRFYAIEETKGIVPSVYDNMTQYAGGQQTASGAAK